MSRKLFRDTKTTYRTIRFEKITVDRELKIANLAILPTVIQK